MANEEQILEFVRRAVPSAWALELLLLMRREPGRSWDTEALIVQLRGSQELVSKSLAALTESGLVSADERGHYTYRPGTPELAALMHSLAELHARKPLAVLSAIFTAPSDRIRSFADAFLFRKK